MSAFSDLRERQGLSQSELARMARVGRQTLIAIEKGTTKGVEFAVLDRLASALGVEPGHLFERASSLRQRRPA